jgi:predicted peptidase
MLLATAVSAALIAGCAGTPSASVPTTPTSVPASHPTALATVMPTFAATSTPTDTPHRLPEGMTAHPAGSGGNDLGILSYLPPTYGTDDGREWPLLVFLHGSEEYGDGSEDQLPKVLANGIPRMIAAGEWPTELPFVVLIPQYPYAEANGPCALNDEIEGVIEWADRTYRIDPARIHLTGISCGAIGVLDYLAGSQARRVAAAVPIASAPYSSASHVGGVRGGCAIARTPTWFFHGALDDIVLVHHVEEAVTELRACQDPPPEEVELTVYPDADHDAWTSTYDGSAGHDIYAWMLEHTGP